MIVLRSFLIGIFAVSVCGAQSVNISGKVTDTGSTPILGAIVSLEKGGQTDTTKFDGSFTLSGNSSIKDQISPLQRHLQFVTIKNGLLFINLQSKSVVEISSYTLQGKTLSVLQQTMDAGTHSIAMPHRGAGVYLNKIKAGGNEFLIKSPSFKGWVSQAVSVQGPSSYNAVAKPAKVAAAINDVIAVTKAGYLDYEVIVTNSDTSGIGIKLIVSAGTVTDIDGNVYQTVRIGGQVWTVDNLRTTKYNDGTSVALDASTATWNDTTAKYCYYNNTTNADTITKYGALYNWCAINTKKLAPAGWHVPDTTEWDTLQNYLIANGYNWPGSITGTMIAKSMASQTDWTIDSNNGTIGTDLAANNKSGFSALPGGYRFSAGSFSDIGNVGYFWSATENSASLAYFRFLLNNNGYVHSSYSDKSCGFSVRLLKD